MSLCKPSPGYTSSIYPLPISFFLLVLYLLYICIYICNNCMFLHTRLLFLLLSIHVFLPILLLPLYSPQPPYCLHICIFFQNFLDPQIHSVYRLTFLLPVLEQVLYTTLPSIFHTRQSPLLFLEPELVTICKNIQYKISIYWQHRSSLRLAEYGIWICRKIRCPIVSWNSLKCKAYTHRQASLISILGQVIMVLQKNVLATHAYVI